MSDAWIDVCDASGVLGMGESDCDWAAYLARMAARRALRSASSCSVDGGEMAAMSSSCSGSGADTEGRGSAFDAGLTGGA